MLKISALFLGIAAAWCAAAHASPSAGIQDPAVVIAQASEFLRQQAMLYPGTPRIEIDASRLDNLPPCAQLQFFLSSGGQLRSRSSVGVRCAAPRAWTSYVQARVSIQGAYYVPARNLSPGETLDAGDLDTRQADLLSLPRDTIIDSGQLLGQIVTRRLIAGASIQGKALRDPQSIMRGQAVRLEARGQGFVASSDGKAVQGGAPGAQIQVRTATGRVVTGTVVDGATVSILM